MRTIVKSSILAAALVVTGTLGVVPQTARACDDADPHAKHHQMMEGMKGDAMKRAKRTLVRFAVPDIALVRDDGQSVALADVLDEGRPVAVNFIFTTCTTICPVMSHIFSQLQTKLGSERDDVRLVSISIDPEQDTPARLREYAKKFKAGPEWSFYTGTTEASVAAQRAFNAYRGDKMDHTPVTFLRAAPDRPWVRIDGFATPDELANELHELVASRE